nr:hypothetical protein [uncultured Draconibacterium sp.]
MIEYLKAMNVETIITFVLFSVSSLYAYYLHRKSKVKKSMEFSYRETFSLFEKIDSLKPDELKVLWKDQQKENIFVTEIYLRNTGTISLKEEDFLRPISITFDKSIEMLKAKVYTSSEFSKLSWDYSSNSVEININTIEKKKLTKVEILYSNDKVSPCNIDLAILDGNTEQVQLSESETNTTLKNLFLSSKGLKKRIYIILLIYCTFIMFFFVPSILENLKDNISFVSHILRLIPYFIVLLPAYIIFRFVKSVSSIYSEKWTEHMSTSEIKKRNKIISNYLMEEV